MQVIVVGTVGTLTKTSNTLSVYEKKKTSDKFQCYV